MKKFITIIIITTVIMCEAGLSQTVNKISQNQVSIEMSISGKLFGTLTLPENTAEKTPIVLIIAGSGPTDRDGNNSIMKKQFSKTIGRTIGAKWYRLCEIRQTRGCRKYVCRQV